LGTAAFAPDGRQLVVPERANLSLIDPQSGRKQRELGEDHAWSRGWQVAFSGDGKRLGGFIRLHHSYPSRKLPVLIRDLTRDRDIHGVTVHFREAQGWVRQAFGAFSPDGRYVAVAQVIGESETELVGWDLTAGKKLGTCRLPGGGKPSLAVAGDGRSAVLAADDKLFICNLIEGRRKGTIDPGWGTILAGPVFSPDHRTFAIATADSKGQAAVRVIEWISWGQRHEFPACPAQTLAFAPDGKTLLSGHRDTTILLWDLTGGRISQDTPPARLWQQLHHEDGAVAGRAIQELVQRPTAALRLVDERLKDKAVAPTRAVVQRLIARLGADSYEDRQSASAELARHRHAIEAHLRAALATKPDLEMRRRLERLLASLDHPTRQEVAQARSVEVLQRIATPQARALLKDLAGTHPAFLGREAAQALRWRVRRPR
jgi:hypothetical protein